MGLYTTNALPWEKNSEGTRNIVITRTYIKSSAANSIYHLHPHQAILNKETQRKNTHPPTPNLEKLINSNSYSPVLRRNQQIPQLLQKQSKQIDQGKVPLEEGVHSKDHTKTKYDFPLPPHKHHPSILLINVKSILSKICNRVTGISLGKDNLKSRELSLIFAYFQQFFRLSSYKDGNEAREGWGMGAPILP